MPPIAASLSLIALVLVNLIPVFGVLVWKWSVFELVSLYWFENVVLGAINVLKMIVCAPDPAQVDIAEALRNHKNKAVVQTMETRPPETWQAIHHAAKLFFIPFFTFHYGMFCFVHGTFIVILLGHKNVLGNAGLTEGLPFMIREIFKTGGVWFAGGIVVSHLISFFSNYIGQGEYKRTSVPALMAAPYGRIVVLHIAILFGAFAIAALGSPIYMLLLLVIGKISLDIKLHNRAHRKLAPEQAVATTV